MKRALLPCAVLLGLAMLVGCGGELAPDGQEGQDSNPAGAQLGRPDAPRAAEQPDGVGPTPADPVPSAVCAQAEQGQRDDIASEEEFRAEIVGVWTLCGDESVFCSAKQGEPLERGLEIEAGGRWYKLYEEGGQLVRGQGFGRQGTWEVIDTSVMNGPGSYQLNLNIDGGGGVIVHPAIAIGPRKMRLNNMGVCVGDYAMEP